MSLQVKPGSIIPEETVRVARVAFPKGNSHLSLRDELGTIYADSLSVALFPKRDSRRNRLGAWCWLQF